MRRVCLVETIEHLNYAALIGAHEEKGVIRDVTIDVERVGSPLLVD